MFDREITDRARELARAKAARRHDIGDADAYGADGVLKDGHSIRVPVSMMDSALPIATMRRSSQPLIIETGMRMDRFYHVDGTPKEPRTPRTARTHQVVDADYSGNRPGYRTAAASGTADAGQSAKDAAYEEMVRDLSDAWKPVQRGQTVSDAQRTADATRRPAGISDAEWERERGIREMCDAWKAPAPVFDAAAVSTMPSGAFTPVGFGANAGDVCSSNGAPGNLVERDGWLFCEVHQPSPTRSGTSSGRDAAVGDRSAQDSAWRQMVLDQQNEWRKQG